MGNNVYRILVLNPCIMGPVETSRHSLEKNTIMEYIVLLINCTGTNFLNAKHRKSIYLHRANAQANSLPRNPPPIMAIDFNPLLIASSNSSKSKIPLNNVTLSLISSEASSNNGRFMGVEPKIDIPELSDLITCTDLSTLQFQLTFKYVHNKRWHKSVLCCTRLFIKIKGNFWTQ